MYPANTIHGLFEARVRSTPEQIAAVMASHSYTCIELNEKANQLAHHLLKSGVKPGTQVAMCLGRSLECLVAILAILKAGCAYVPLDASQPKDRLLFLLKDNDMPALILTSDLSEKFNSYKGKLVRLDRDAKKIARRSSGNPDTVMTPQYLAYVIYTSGSTGTPKGVMIRHDSIVNYSLWLAQYSNIQPEQRIDFSSNYVFDMAVTTSIVSLALGVTVVICDDEVKKGVRDYLEHLEYNRINIIKTTPSYFKVLLLEAERNPVSLPYLYTIILGGEPLTSTECAGWLALYPEHVLYNEYGPTEATVAVTHFKVDKTNLSLLGTNVPVGKPGLNMSCHILNENGSLVRDGDVGELYIGGVCLASGYRNQPQLTQKQFINHLLGKRLYKTGDLCRLLPDGNIEYLGRSDSQLKIRGFRVEPGEIEKCLIAHPAIKTAIVMARADGANEKRLIAYYILNKPGKALSVGQFREHLGKYLPDYMIPGAYVCVDTFPLTANGKLNPEALPIPQFVNSLTFLAPTSELEKTLAGIWSEELGVTAIGLKDDFFEAGGHSLSASRVISEINHRLGKNISLYDFYASPTIASLVLLLNEKKQTRRRKPALRKSPWYDSDYLPLSDFQFLLWVSNTFEPKAKKLNITARKRIYGKLDMAALHFAFTAVIRKHEILLYQILKFRPIQTLHKKYPFEVMEKHLEMLSEPESDQVLEDSFCQLIKYYPWPRQSSMLIARVFHLKNDMSELQIAVPHIVSDDTSINVLFRDLSTFYSLYRSFSDNTRKLCQSTFDGLSVDKQYRYYTINEQFYFQKYLDRDISFWRKYLKDASAFPFPQEQVVKDMVSEGFCYSTYLQIPESSLHDFQQFCAKNQISIHDGLCAAVTQAIYRCCEPDGKMSQTVFLNIVKSTRVNQSYDDAIGCFLRLEPIKIEIGKESTLPVLSKQVHKAAMDTSSYQQCSSMVKMACIKSFYQERRAFENYLIRMLGWMYTAWFPNPKLYRKIIDVCSKLSKIERKNNFMVNINVQANLFSDEKMKSEKTLFGWNTGEIKVHQYDLLSVDYFFDVCFQRNDNPDILFLVISANLQPAFREQIAKEVLRIIKKA